MARLLGCKSSVSVWLWTCRDNVSLTVTILLVGIFFTLFPKALPNNPWLHTIVFLDGIKSIHLVQMIRDFTGELSCAASLLYFTRPIHRLNKARTANSSHCLYSDIHWIYHWHRICKSTRWTTSSYFLWCWQTSTRAFYAALSFLHWR